MRNGAHLPTSNTRCKEIAVDAFVGVEEAFYNATFNIQNEAVRHRRGRFRMWMDTRRAVTQNCIRIYKWTNS